MDFSPHSPFDQFLGWLRIANGNSEMVDRSDIIQALLVALAILWATNSHGDQKWQ